MKYMHYEIDKNFKSIITKSNLTKLLSSKPQPVKYWFSDRIQDLKDYHSRKVQDLLYRHGDESKSNKAYIRSMGDACISPINGAIEAPVIKFDSYNSDHIIVSCMYNNTTYTMLLSIITTGARYGNHILVKRTRLELSDPSRGVDELYENSIDEAPAIVYLAFLVYISEWLGADHYNDEKNSEYCTALDDLEDDDSCIGYCNHHNNRYNGRDYSMMDEDDAWYAREVGL